MQRAYEHAVRWRTTDPKIFAGGDLSEQAIETVAIEHIALAGGAFEAVAIGDRDFALLEANQAGALELPRSFGDAGASDAEHRRQELVRHRNDVRGMSRPRHQEPAGTTLLNRVETIARR